MDEKRIEEMKKLGEKQDLTPEERERFNELFREFMEKKMKWYVTPKKESDR